MKTFLCLFLLFLMWQVRAEQPDYIYKADAQICKPYFLQCRQNPDKEISACFQETYYSCIPTFREAFQAIEQCAAEAGEDLESLLSCRKGVTGA
ncbi:uncharacterized protein LOC110040228 [Orbicella faveolata]|uniref:uncharacterized protein LOC110040228 n=1 Tax=Orbicella faveolata TaxID=48498 RepID=UPI0009E2C6B0|nr:uncharacterized protein LOC110040228 [Orbicella faveolata]XP_020601092.1 uncharacterized protein LOC110040228 [Orbicella faveolata]